MGAYTPSEAAALLRDKAAGQDIFIAVVTGPDAKQRERLAINRFDRCSTIDCGPTLVSVGTITAVCSSMTGELAQTLTGIASDFGDELYSKRIAGNRRTNTGNVSNGNSRSVPKQAAAYR